MTGLGGSLRYSKLGLLCSRSASSCKFSTSSKTEGISADICASFIPESPRFLISKDRSDEAFKVLVKYHAEGNADSEFVKAEMAQIEGTIQIEIEHSKRSWGEMISQPGMRRRVIIGSMLGLFTQWSGNTLIS
jgi:hypothetical protein